MKKILGLLLICSSIIAEGKISGIGFYNYTYNLAEGAEGTDKGGFSFDRIYFTYKNTLSDKISFKFQTDVGRFNFIDKDANDNIIEGDKSNLFAYIKKAQLDWKFSIGKITLGMQGMNMFNVIEKTWGFRFIEKSPMDKHESSSSADMGIGVSGKFKNLNYSILSTNGSGYKKQETDAFKKTSAQLVYGQKNLVKKDGFNIGTSFSYEPYTANYTKKVMSIFYGYAGSKLRIGGELDMDIDSGTNQRKQILAFYSSYKAMNNLEGLIYFDMYDPDMSINNNSETYIIVGINYYPAKGLIITPNIRTTFFDDGSDSKTILKMNFQFGF